MYQNGYVYGRQRDFELALAIGAPSNVKQLWRPKKKTKKEKRKANKARAAKMPLRKNWYLYVLELEGNRVYVGISTNIQRRFNKHLEGKGSVYTKRWKPIKIAHSEYLGLMTDAQAASHENAMVERQQKIRKKGEVFGGNAYKYHGIKAKHLDPMRRSSNQKS